MSWLTPAALLLLAISWSVLVTDGRSAHERNEPNGSRPEARIDRERLYERNDGGPALLEVRPAVQDLRIEKPDDGTDDAEPLPLGEGDVDGELTGDRPDPQPAEPPPAVANVAVLPGRTRDLVSRDWRPLLCSYDWPCDVVVLIVYGPTPRCPTGESTGRAGAIGSSGERGLLQLYPGHAWRFVRRGWTFDDAFDAERNVAIAYEIYRERGFAPWTCRP